MKKEELGEKRNYHVVKANALIQKARYNLTLQEQKIVVYLISKILPTDEDFEVYGFNIQDFCQICGIDDKSGFHYSDLKQTIQKLANKSAWIKTDDNKEILLRWINEASIQKNDGTINVEISKNMKPFLLQLKEQFTQYNLYYILAMRSRYSIRLYELLKSYEYKKECDFSIDEFKTLLDATNYYRFNDFKKNVLDLALKEINGYGDIEVTYTLGKTKQRFTKIKFHIKKRQTMEKVDVWINIEKRLNPNRTIRA